MLTYLKGCLTTRAGQSADLQEVEATTAQLEGVVGAASWPEYHPGRAQRLINLQAYRGSRYQRTGNLQDLEAAIAISEATVEAIPEDHPNRVALLNNLGNRLSWRYNRTGNQGDWEAAIYIAEETIDATTEDHPFRVVLM